MTEYKCGSCQETFKAFYEKPRGPDNKLNCPYCGSSSLIMLVKEAADESKTRKKKTEE